MQSCVYIGSFIGKYYEFYYLYRTYYSHESLWKGNREEYGLYLYDLLFRFNCYTLPSRIWLLLSPTLYIKSPLWLRLVTFTHLYPSFCLFTCWNKTKTEKLTQTNKITECTIRFIHIGVYFRLWIIYDNKGFLNHNAWNSCSLNIMWLYFDSHTSKVLRYWLTFKTCNKYSRIWWLNTLV